MSDPRPSQSIPELSPQDGAQGAERAEAQLRELRQQREDMRAEWDALMAELGNPALPTEAELDRMIRDLPAQDRAELRRYHDETQALKSAFRTEPTQPTRRATENLLINRHAIRC